MRILQGCHAGSFKEAAALASQEARVGDMSLEVAELLTTAIDENKFRGEADKAIRAAVRERFGGKAVWEKEYWFIPVPELGFDAKSIPQLTIMGQLYLVSPVEVETPDDFYSIVVVGTIGKLEVLTIPMVLLHAILHDDLGRFRILARSGNRTVWEILGTTPVELPNEFLAKLSQTLERQSVAGWLGSFGAQARSIIPLAVGALWGLQCMGVAQPIPTGQQAWSREIIINDLVEGLAYKTKEAEEMFDRAAPNLRADYTREEVLVIILQQAGKGE